MAEKEYIERETVLKVVSQIMCDVKVHHKHRAINRNIKQLPTADVQEVVRCRDCRLRSTEECSMYYRCNCGEQHTWENNNDFCSYGERK